MGGEQTDSRGVTKILMMKIITFISVYALQLEKVWRVDLTMFTLEWNSG